MRINADKAIARAEAKFNKLDNSQKLALLWVLDHFISQQIGREVISMFVYDELENSLGFKQEIVEHRDGELTTYWLTEE